MQSEIDNSALIYSLSENPRDWPIGKQNGKMLVKFEKKKNQEMLGLIYDFEQSDKGGKVKSQLTTL